MELKQMYKYRISGDYYADDKLIYFEDVVSAPENYTAMQMVVGKYAWQESLQHHTFKLRYLHYDVWERG